MKTKKFQKNIKKFSKLLKKKFKRLMVAKKLNMGKILQKLGLNLRLLTINIWSVFSEDDKFYHQLFLDVALYEL